MTELEREFEGTIAAPWISNPLEQARTGFASSSIHPLLRRLVDLIKGLSRTPLLAWAPLHSSPTIPFETDRPMASLRKWYYGYLRSEL